MSVASADPTFQYGTSGVDSSNSIIGPSEITVDNVTWNDDSGLLKPITSGSTVIDTIDIVLQQNLNNGASSVSGSTLTITGGGQIATDRQPVIQLISSQGITLGSNGSGKIKVDFSSANYATSDYTKSRTVILDFSSVASGIALKGDILVGTGSATDNAGWGNENSFIGKFGGEGIKGNITINRTGDGDGFKSKFIFSGNAKLDGNLTLGANDRSEPHNTFIFDNGDITGTLSTRASGSTTIIYGQGNKTLATSLDVMAGTLTYKFADTVTANKVFMLDTSASQTQVDTDGDGTPDATRSKIDISGGRVVFDGVSQLIFKNGSSDANGGGGTLTIAPKTILENSKKVTFQNGSLVINLDSSAQTGANNPIIKGSLNATNGGISIAFKDTTGKTGANPFTNPNAQLSSLDTYYITGSVSITNGGFSAFWDDSLGFYGKLSTSVNASGSLIGKNDVWFSQAQNINSIQATSGGVSHLVFDSKATLAGDSSIGIKSTQNNATQILFKGGADITGSITQVRNGYNNITFGAKSSITGNIIANGNMKGNDGTAEKIGNTIIFNNGGKIKGNLSVTSGDGFSLGGYNLNAITFDGTEDATIEGTINASDGGSGRGNVIKFNGSGNNKIVGNISTSPDQAGASGRNYIVFGANSSSAVIKGTITVQGGINDIEFKGANGVIDGQVVANVSSGNNDGNKITFADGGSITGGVSVVETDTSKTGYTLNTITFGGTNDATISGGITSNDGSEGKGNIINFNGTGTNKVDGGISASVSAWGGAGRNEITFADKSTSSIEGDIGTTLGGVNIITFNGENGSITGNISATGNANSGTKGGNQITFANGGSITGDISTNTSSDTSSWAGSTHNQITFGGTNNATIEGNISSIDGGAGKGNIISFNGSGTNQIIGNITSSAGALDGTNGRNLITFGISTHTAIIDGNITAENNATYYDRAGGINQIDTNSSLSIKGDIVITRKGTNNISLLSNGIGLSLVGKDTAGTNHEISSLSVVQNGTNTLTLNNSAVTSGAMATTIHSITNGGNLAVVLNSKGTSEGVSLSLTNATALKSVTLAGAKGNALTFNAGANSVTEKINVGDTQDLALNLAGATTSLNLAGGLSGGAISVSTTNGVLSGGAIDGASMTFADSKKLTLKNTSAVFTTVDASAGSATLKLDGTSNAVNTTINSLKDGNNLTVAFNGRGEGSGATLKINGVDSGNTLTLASVSLENNSTNNTLDLSNLADSVTSVNFGGNGIVVGDADNRQGLSIKVKGLGSNNARAITFTNGLTTTNGVSTLTILDGNATLSATANGINLTNLDISAKNASSTVTFLSSATIGSLTAQADKGSNLVVGNASDKGAGTQTPYSLTIGTTNSTLNSVTLEGGDTTTLTINGGTQTINTLTLNASENKLTLSNKNNLTIGEIVNGGNSFNVELTDSTLSLAGDTNKIDSLVTDDSSVINLAVGHNGTNKARAVTPKLTIGNLNGNLTANILVSKSQSDLIKINDATNPDTTLTLYARGNAGEIISITRNDNVLVADTSGAITQSKTVDVIGGTSDIGGLVVALTVEEDNQTKGKWYVGKTEVKGVDTSFQEVASSALAVNYDLYLANFNSLNKRMGELRDNPYSQGVWARVFGGAMSNDIGSGSKTQYVTAQAGYDYSLTLGNANNYMGIAVAYGTSATKANEGVGLTNAFLDNINSQMVEVGIYNSYVMDNGWYNDTIFKFDYIMSDFDISVQSGGTSSHSTNNFAMILSDEFGYRYKFAESEKGNWYIDPQVEVAFGYFNQSDFNQAIADNFATVEASQDSILTLRTRAGISLGKKFNTAKGFASLYVGAFYEYDYIEGGNAQTQVLTATNSIDRVESNGRAIVNVGSNIELTEGVRMYIDVEKSFGDKQRTDMQFNFGARYSFGEKVPTISYQEQQKKKVAPLKVEEKQEVSNTQSATQEQEAKN